MVNLIFDLDGTLIDSRLRLYRLFQQLVPTSSLTYESYWAFKRQKISNETILATQFNWGPTKIERFLIDWMNLIETPQYLALDINFPGMQQALNRLKKKARLYVCTARQHQKLAVDQLADLGLEPYFERIMVTERKRTKEDLIITIPDLGQDDWVIGDTGKDIQVGQNLGIRTCGVLSGFLNEKALRSYMPEIILSSAADFSLR